MTQLAVRQPGAGPGISVHRQPANPPMDIADVWQMAEYVADSKLFPGVTGPQAAFTLMMLCQADGMHPIHAMRRYHIIEGRPSMRADAMQAEFQADGGKIEILRCDAQEARAIFSHPVHHPRPFECSVTMEQLEKSGLARGREGLKTNYRQHPDAMLWARLVTKAIRRVHPGIVVGISSPEEVQEVIEVEAREARPGPAPALSSPRRGEVAVPGWSGAAGADGRPYHQVVTEAVATINERFAHSCHAALGPGEVPAGYAVIDPHDVHKHLMNAAIQGGYHGGPPPAKRSAAIQALAAVYSAQRDWMRSELAVFLDRVAERRCGVLNEELERRAAEAEQARSGETPEEAPGEGLGPPGEREPGEDG